ncbi:hypothetical protein [Streptomyces parvulus]|uniref:hypothetical protein n=1 Tax=Streptomyces parvulus TaxID=146923 RepID=UPI003D9F9843
MSAQDDEDGGEVARFAAQKERTDRSYGSLARRLGMNTLTLHRNCTSEAVPLDFAPEERFAALCGATPEQRMELHRRWLLAVAASHRPRTVPPPDAAAAAVDEADDTTVRASRWRATTGRVSPAGLTGAGRPPHRIAARPRGRRCPRRAGRTTANVPWPHWPAPVP